MNRTFIYLGRWKLIQFKIYDSMWLLIKASDLNTIFFQLVSFTFLFVYTSFPVRPGELLSKALTTPALLSSAEPAGLQEVQYFVGRIQFYQYLGKHQNLVHLEGCCTERLPLYMVLEDVAQGNLLSFLWTCRRVSSRVEVLGGKGVTGWLPFHCQLAWQMTKSKREYNSIAEYFEYHCLVEWLQW